MDVRNYPMIQLLSLKELKSHPNLGHQPSWWRFYLVLENNIGIAF